MTGEEALVNNSSSLSLSQLYNFKKLAETQHMTRAAKELYITQPTLSLSIKALEHELGVPLFFRDGRQIKLTKHGRRLLCRYCRCARRSRSQHRRRPLSGLGGMRIAQHRHHSHDTARLPSRAAAAILEGVRIRREDGVHSGVLAAAHSRAQGPGIRSDLRFQGG